MGEKVKISCPHCGARFYATKEQIGRQIKCSKCAGVFTASKYEPPEVPQEIDESQSVEKTGAAKSILGKMSTLGSTIAGAIRPEGFDEIKQAAGAEKDRTAFIINDRFFGGRNKIGAPVYAMSNPGFYVGAMLFSWFYLFSFLKSLLSNWEFVPFSRTEFIRFSLKEHLMRRRILPVFVLWLLGFILLLFATGLCSNLLHPAFGVIVLIAGYIVINLISIMQLKAIGDNLKRTCVCVDYGFPVKYNLLTIYSDQPTEAQIQAVTQLSELLEKCKFSQWDQISTHGSGSNGVLSAIYSKVRG